MTGQSHDGIVYEGEHYSLVALTGSALFDPAQIGLEVHSWSTADNRGFHCIYGVEDRALYLIKLYVGLFPQEGKPLPTIFGKLPHKYTYKAFGTTLKALKDRSSQWEEKEYESPEYVVEDIQELIPFTGGILIGRDFIREMYVHAGFQSAYKFSVLHELVFDEGHLLEAHERSAQVAEFREMLPTLPNWDDLEARHTRVKEWVLQHFNFMYGSFVF